MPELALVPTLVPEPASVLVLSPEPVLVLALVPTTRPRARAAALGLPLAPVGRCLANPGTNDHSILAAS